MIPVHLDENATFHMIELVDGSKPTGHFRLQRTTGTLAYAPILFVVDDQGDRIWPMQHVMCLYPNER